MVKKTAVRTKVLTRSLRKRAVAGIAAVLICVVAATMLAQVNSRKKGKTGSGDFSVAGLSASMPSKEYIWAGSKLISTVEPTAVNGNDAEFVSMLYEEPCSNCLGCGASWLPIGPGSFGLPDPQEYTVHVTMKNTGSPTATWTSGNFYLASQNPSGNTTWRPSTVALPTSVLPGQSYTFEFRVRRPSSAPGPFNFQWQMVGPDGYFGEKTNNAVIPSGAWQCSSAPANFATFVSQSVPSSMTAGQAYFVSVTMNNAGSSTWTTAGNYKLGSRLPQNNTYWGANREPLPSSVAPSGNVTFNFSVTAPSTAGTYFFQWMMVQDGGAGWFGYLTPSVAVTVTPGCGSPPSVPLNLSATAQSSTSVLIAWNASSGTDHYEVQRKQNISSQWVTLSPNPTANSFPDNGLAPNTCYLYQVRAADASSNCASAYSNVDLATTVMFTEDPLQSRNTIIRAQHVIEVRQAVNAVRTTANIGGATWTNPLNYRDPVRPIDFSELRSRLNEALSQLGVSPIPTDPGIAQGLTIYATHLQAVRNKVK